MWAQHRRLDTVFRVLCVSACWVLWCVVCYCNSLCCLELLTVSSVVLFVCLVCFVVHWMSSAVWRVQRLVRRVFPVPSGYPSSSLNFAQLSSSWTVNHPRTSETLWIASQMKVEWVGVWSCATVGGDFTNCSNFPATWFWRETLSTWKKICPLLTLTRSGFPMFLCLVSYVKPCT